MKALNYMAIGSIIGVGLLVGSCKKDIRTFENVKTTSNQEFKSSEDSLIGEYVDSVYITKDSIVYTYYFNNVKMKTIDFNPAITSEASNTDDFTFIIPQFDQDSSISGIIIRQFSDKEGYIAFGKSMDAEFEDYVNFRDVVINYAIQNGVIAEYESTETVPTSFVTWYETELNTTFNAPTLFPVTVYKDYKGGPAWMHPLGYAFFMAPGWNNKVSRYMHLTAITYGWMFIYDKAFFKKHLATLRDFGWKYVYFAGPLAYLNDRMSSFNTI